jgi:hypothetical protein
MTLLLAALCSGVVALCCIPIRFYQLQRILYYLMAHVRAMVCDV